MAVNQRRARSSRAPVRLAVAGAGLWGRNHVRVLHGLPGVKLTAVIDPDLVRRAAAEALAPGVRTFSSLAEALDGLPARARPDGLIVASPAPTHGPITRAALHAGLHVLAEKPLTPTSKEGMALVRLAKRKGLLLGVGHLLLHHPAVRRLESLVTSGRLGALRYIHCQRTNLGRVRPDEGALLSLAPHDVSIMVRLFGAWPIGVSARGATMAQPTHEDVVFVVLRFPGNRLGHIHLSWLDPLKVRCVSVVGEKAMAVFDDMETPERRLRIIAPKGRVPGRDRKETLIRVAAREPLRAELAAFAASIRGTNPFPTPGIDGARIVRVLEAAATSLQQNGCEVPVRIRVPKT